jgi:GDP-D-mannose 3',5'-epimerase
MSKILILGAFGFLGQHLEHRLKADGHFVVSVGRGRPRYRKSVADETNVLDLTSDSDLLNLLRRHQFAGVYQLAGEVGGLGYIGNATHDAAILSNSVRINLNVLEAIRKTEAVDKVFFASSQCVYPDVLGVDPFAQERIPDPRYLARACRETDASFNTFPFAQEKLFSEQLYAAYARDYGVRISIGRLGNTYGPYCTWDGERAKAPAAICRKVAQAQYAGLVRLWGNGTQTRSYTYVDDAVEGMIRLMASDYEKPVNISHSGAVSTVALFETTCRVAGKVLAWEPEPGPVGVRHRVSDNTLCREVLGWEPTTSLFNGLSETYHWIARQALTKTDA